MKSSLALLLSILINFTVFAAVPVLTNSYNHIKDRRENRPIPINFVRVKRKIAEPKTEPEHKTVKVTRRKRVESKVVMPDDIQSINQPVVAKDAPIPVINTAPPSPAKDPAPNIVPVPEAPKEAAVTPKPVAREDAAIVKTPMEPVMTAHNDAPLPSAAATAYPDAPHDEFVPLKMLTLMPSVDGGLRPVYPEKARRMNKEGVVKLEVAIDAGGQVMDAKVIAGAGYGFDEAALEAVTNAKFAAAMVDEKPVPVKVLIPIQFKLE